jgi:hypothetical protein
MSEKAQNELHNLASLAAIRSTDCLGARDQLLILERARNAMRDLEALYRKRADDWHTQGAKCEARRCYDMAEAVDEAICELRAVESIYISAKHLPQPNEKDSPIK